MVVTIGIEIALLAVVVVSVVMTPVHFVSLKQLVD